MAFGRVRQKEKETFRLVIGAHWKSFSQTKVIAEFSSLSLTDPGSQEASQSLRLRPATPDSGCSVKS